MSGIVYVNAVLAELGKLADQAEAAHEKPPSADHAAIWVGIERCIDAVRAMPERSTVIEPNAFDALAEVVCGARSSWWVGT